MREFDYIHEDELEELGIEYVNTDQSIPEALDVPFHDPWVKVYLIEQHH